MVLKRTVLVMAAALFAVALAVYMGLYAMWDKLRAPSRLALADECTDESASISQTNPNKMLFISCGGFLE